MNMNLFIFLMYVRLWKFTEYGKPDYFNITD